MQKFRVTFLDADRKPLILECRYMEDGGGSYVFRDGTKINDVVAVVPIRNVEKVERVNP